MFRFFCEEKMNKKKLIKIYHFAESYFLQNGSGEVSESASTSSIGSNSSHSKAPGAQLTHNNQNKNISSILNYTAQMQFGLCGQEYNNDIAKQMLSLDNDSMLGPMDKEQKRLCLSYGLGTHGMSMNNSFDNTVESVVGERLSISFSI